MKTLFASLLLLLTLLTFSNIVPAAKICPDCGSTPVPYPLSTGPDCGDQNYKIRCASGTLWFDALYGNSYSISSINPKNQRLVIHPPNFIDPNTCITTDFHSQGFYLNSSLPFNITSSNTILYLNCSKRMLRSPLNCSSTSLCHTYIDDTEEGSRACKNTQICCSFKTGGSSTAYKIRVRERGCRAYRSYVYLELDTKLPVTKWPSLGLELEWKVPQELFCQSQDDCDSTTPNSRCHSDLNAIDQKRCFCNSGFEWDPIHGTCTNTKNLT